MSKFWGVVATLFIIGMASIAVGSQTTEKNGINFTDLETECRYNHQESSQISVNLQNDRLSFEGQFPINNTRSDLTYDYRVSQDEIILNIVPEKMDRPESFWHNCLGLVNYKAQTDILKEGRYRVEVQHDGERVEEKIIRFG